MHLPTVGENGEERMPGLSQPWKWLNPDRQARGVVLRPRCQRMLVTETRNSRPYRATSSIRRRTILERYSRTYDPAVLLGGTQLLTSEATM